MSKFSVPTREWPYFAPFEQKSACSMLTYSYMLRLNKQIFVQNPSKSGHSTELQHFDEQLS